MATARSVRRHGNFTRRSGSFSWCRSYIYITRRREQNDRVRFGRAISSVVYRKCRKRPPVNVGTYRCYLTVKTNVPCVRRKRPRKRLHNTAFHRSTRSPGHTCPAYTRVSQLIAIVFIVRLARTLLYANNGISVTSL